MSGVAAAPSGASPSPLSRARRALARFTGVGASKYDELEEVEFTKLRADDDGDGDGEDDGHDEDWEDALYAADAKASSSSGRTMSPEDEASLLSKIFFTYVTPLIKKGSKKALETHDLWRTAESDRVGDLADAYRRAHDELRDAGKKFTCFRILVKLHARRFFSAGGVKVVHDSIELCGPLLLQRLLKAIADGAPATESGGIAVAMGALACTQTLLINQYFHILFRVSVHTKVQLISAIYRKALTVSSSGYAKVGSGKVNNLQSNDAAKLWNMPQYLHQIWNAPLKLCAIMVMLSRIIHVVPAFVGLCVTIVMIPAGSLVAKRLGKMRRELLKKTDARVKYVTEFVTGIKAMKLYAWESAYMKKITQLREEELRMVRRIAFLNIANMMLFFASPILVALAAFWTYALMGYTLDASVAFPALSLFNILRFPVLMLPMQIMNLINARVSFKRVHDFFDQKDREALPPATRAGDKAPKDEGDAVAIRNGDFSWSAEAALALKNVNLTVAKGELVMVVGQVGSGKSSLLSAMLGEMVCKNGGCTVGGTCAFTSQEPWIQNASLRDNILASSSNKADLDTARYEEVLDVCALRADLDILPGGDLAEIGEKGINISGGQKHRIALARAVYAGADVYLLDDPLSAVDAHVSRHIFDECIKGTLSGKTRILVTHQVQFASEVDRILVFKDGCLEHVGTYEELTQAGVAFSQFQGKGDDEGGEDEGEEKPGALAEKAGGKPVANGHPAANGHGRANGMKKSPSSGALVKAEERSKGRVKKAVYVKYIRSCGPYLILPAIFLLCAFTERGLQVGQNFVLADWSSEEDDSWRTVQYYLVFYSLLAMSSLCFLGLRSFTMANGAFAASKAMHSGLLSKVGSLPMSFFDSQPAGRLINRFTRDTESLDSTISQSLNSATVCGVSTFFSVMVVCWVTPWVMLMIVPVSLMYVRVQLFYIGASRELKRLDSLAMSPIFSNFVETLQGLSVIRAFGLETNFDKKNLGLLTKSNRAYWPLVSSNRWLSIRLEYLGSSITFTCALVSAIASANSAGMSGLAITSAMNMTGLMTWMVRQMTELEVNMNSIERLTEYDGHESEGDSNRHLTREVSSSWPSKGKIVFDKVYVKYRPDLPHVLKGLAFTVGGGEKIGVCGRTGCGKSTMMMTLYRMVELDRGSITIDDVDIATTALPDLRSKLSLVPQDPVIFSGTVRSNLDPFNETEGDAEIWNALKLSGLKSTIQELPDKKGLDSSIDEGGGNLSVGQKQLLCMARALIRKSKILILDEATSNVDGETDTLIQNTIRMAFKDCTVLTIAHRLNTIIDSDKILLLDGGEVAEFDSPETLLSNPNSKFAEMVEKARDNSGMKKSKSSSSIVLE